MKIGIIGQGYSGVMLAILLKRHDLNIDVTIFDHNEKTNKKLLATGNGRCNLGNLEYNNNTFNSEFTKNLYLNFDISKQRELFNELGLETRTINNLVYPYSLSSNQVVAYLNRLLKEYKVKLVNGVNLNSYEVSDDFVTIAMSNRKTYKFDKVIFATGGKSKEVLGSDGSIFRILKTHNYTIKDLKVGLAPIKVSENVKGIENERLKCIASLYLDKDLVYQEDGEVLIKKDGLSGISIFNISSIIARNKTAKKTRIVLDLFKDYKIEELEEKFEKYSRIAGFSFLEGIFTIKMSDYIRKNSGVKNLYDFDNREIKRIAEYTKNMEFTYISTYDFNDSQVTIGGVSINNLNDDLSSKLEKNIYMIGEMIDIDGLCGGYNLMLCLASANKAYTSLINN